MHRFFTSKGTQVGDPQYITYQEPSTAYNCCEEYQAFRENPDSCLKEVEENTTYVFQDGVCYESVST